MLAASVLEEPLVGLAVGVLAEALEADDADDPVAGQDRHAEPRFRVRAADLDRTRGRLLLGVPNRSERPVRMTVDVSPGPSGSMPRSNRSPSSMSYGNDSRSVVGVVEGDEQRPRVEDLADPLADELDDRLELELLGEGLADLVDEGQLGVPLAGLLDRPDPASAPIRCAGRRTRGGRGRPSCSARRPGRSGTTTTPIVRPSAVSGAPSQSPTRRRPIELDLAGLDQASGATRRSRMHRAARSAGRRPSSRGALPTPNGSQTAGSGMSCRPCRRSTGS